MAHKQRKAGENEAVMQLIYGISVAQLTSSVFSKDLCVNLHACILSGAESTKKGLANDTSIAVLVVMQETRRF